MEAFVTLIVIVIFYIEMFICRGADLEADKGTQVYAAVLDAAKAV
jgi:hypothetical protein